MKTTISVYDFRDAFKRAGRADQLSYDALGLIYDFFESVDPDYDLDIIAICCEFSEQSPAAIAADYSIDIDENKNDEEIASEVLSYLERKTHVIGETDDGKFVYIQF